jgi:hypothetical protein
MSRHLRRLRRRRWRGDVAASRFVGVLGRFEPKFDVRD